MYQVPVFWYQAYQAQLWECMLNRSASLAMSTSVLKALPGKLDIKRHSPSILYFYTYPESIPFSHHSWQLSSANLTANTLAQLWEFMLNRSASLAMSTSLLKALPGKLDIKRHSPSILYFYTYPESIPFSHHLWKLSSAHLTANTLWKPILQTIWSSLISVYSVCIYDQG